VVEGSSALRLEARRGFSYLTVEELGSISDSRDSDLFKRAQSFFSPGNGNSFGKFLKVVVFAAGGRRGLLSGGGFCQGCLRYETVGASWGPSGQGLL
jgi:hypothetical protein